MPDIYLRSVPSDAAPSDVRLYDPTVADSASDTVTLDKADVAFTGKAVVEVELVGISIASLVGFTGKTVSEVETILVSSASVAVASKSVLGVDADAVGSSSIAFAGQAVTASDLGSDLITVDAAAVTFTGNDVIAPLEAGQVVVPERTWPMVRRSKRKGPDIGLIRELQRQWQELHEAETAKKKLALLAEAKDTVQEIAQEPVSPSVKRAIERLLQSSLPSNMTVDNARSLLQEIEDEEDELEAIIYALA